MASDIQKPINPGKTSRGISAIATVNSQVSQPHADLIGSMDSVDGVFSTFGMSQVS